MIIRGVAVQIHLPDPRTTVDIDIALVGAVPADRLRAKGFTAGGVFAHSQNWVGPDGTPIQFTNDPALAAAISRADTIERAGVRLRVIRRIDLLHEKFRSGSDPARRRWKRLQDLGDVQALLEADPSLLAELIAAERALLERLP